MAEASLDRQIIDRIKQLDDVQKQRVLDFVNEALEQPRRYTARELMKLPREEHQRLMAEALEAAADEDFEVFEAYSMETIDD